MHVYCLHVKLLYSCHVFDCWICTGRQPTNKLSIYLSIYLSLKVYQHWYIFSSLPYVLYVVSFLPINGRASILQCNNCSLNLFLIRRLCVDYDGERKTSPECWTWSSDTYCWESYGWHCTSAQACSLAGLCDIISIDTFYMRYTVIMYQSQNWKDCRILSFLLVWFYST